MSKIKIKHYFIGPLEVNTYLAYDDSGCAFVVDPGGEDSSLISEIKGSNLELKYIVLTHGHGDHIGGVESLLEEFPEAKVVAHAEDRQMLEDPWLNSSTGMYGRPITVKTDITVGNKDTLQCGDMTLEFLHTPGHTPGGICILCQDVCFSGDTLFRASVGRTDSAVGDFQALSDSIKEKLYCLPDDTLVLPGHMGETTIGFEKRYNPFVRA